VGTYINVNGTSGKCPLENKQEAFSELALCNILLYMTFISQPFYFC